MTPIPVAIVCVRPAIAANVGAIARVMKNFGVSDLRLVAPHADPLDEQARKLSTHGEEILHAARSFEDFGDAVQDCVLVLGTSARVGGPVRRQSVVRLDQIMPRVVQAQQQGRVAMVFGPEQTGLADAEVTRCHYLVTIPTDENYPALNLAQAVAISLYEWRKAWLERTSLPMAAEAASFKLQERMFKNLEEALRQIHFLWGDNAESLMHALRHLLGRAQLSEMEVELLLGLARQLRWFAERQSATPAPPVATDG